MNGEQMIIGGILSPKYRDERIDSVKYCLMVLVVVGHVFSRKPFTSTQGCSVVWEWIYMFHMPLFVFLSGYFSYKKDIKNHILSCWKLFEPLLIFQLLMRGIEYLSTGSVTWKDLLTPWWVLWYLLSLIYWRALVQFMPNRLLRNIKSFFIFAFLVSIISGLLPFNRFLSLQRTLSFFPFFFLGYCMKGRRLFISAKYKPLCFIFLALTIIFPLFFSKYLGDLNQAQPYDNIRGIFYRTFVFCLSFPMSVAFINLCPNTPWISRQGRFTLYYYICHALIIYFFQIIIDKYNLPTSFLAATIYSIVLIVVLGITSYFPGIDSFTNPSIFLKKTNNTYN